MKKNEGIGNALGVVIVAIAAIIVTVILWRVFHMNWLLAIPPVLLVNYVFYRILTTKMTDVDAPDLETISTGKVMNGINVLRYAAAALALISIFTTASGLSSFVFTGGTKTSYVLAGFASFAIQSILLVFSLLFFHIRLKLESIDKLTETFKKAVLFMAVMLFTLSIIASSSFSYVFIANNTYDQMYAKNSNITIEHFLRDETKSLQEVNEIVGALVRDDVEGRTKDLQEKMKGKKTSSGQSIKEQLEGLSESEPEESTESEEAKSFFSEGERDGLKAAHKGFESEYDRVYLEFQEDYNVYSAAFEKYENALKFLKENDQYDKSSLESKLEDLNNQIFQLERAIERIDHHSTTPEKDGMETYRNTASSKCQHLETNITTLVGYYNKLLQSFASDIDTIKKIREILYVSRWQDSIDVEELTSIYDAVIEIIAEEAETTQDNDSSEDLASLNGFLTSFEDFIKYVRLDKKLKEYLDGQLSITYYIKTAEEEEQDIPTNPSSSKTIKIVNEAQWRQARKNDFIDLCDSINSLPDLSAYETSDELTEEERNILKNYSPSDALMQAYTMNRDLLEDISDFEKAINYFKYDFRLMAILSLSLALFFDIVSSLTGGFMFAAAFLKAKPHQEDDQEEGGAETEKDNQQAADKQPEP